MSERERWVIYPLLFLALGASLRDKLFDRTMSKSIVCQEITIVEEEPIGRQPGRVLAKIGRTQSAGSPSRGFLFVNGELEVVDQIAGNQPVPVLFTRTRSAPGRVPHPVVTVSGLFEVDGVVNAKQYAIQGVPFMHALQSLLPVPLSDFFRAVQPQQAAGAPAQPAPEKAEATDAEQPASPADESTFDERSSAEPAADPSQPSEQ